MFYAYQCKNEECEEFEKEFTVSKPMSEVSNPEFCKKCEKEVSRVYGLAGHQTFGDGYKS